MLSSVKKFVVTGGLSGQDVLILVLVVTKDTESVSHRSTVTSGVVRVVLDVPVDRSDNRSEAVVTDDMDDRQSNVYNQSFVCMDDVTSSGDGSKVEVNKSSHEEVEAFTKVDEFDPNK